MRSLPPGEHSGSHGIHLRAHEDPDLPDHPGIPTHPQCPRSNSRPNVQKAALSYLVVGGAEYYKSQISAKIKSCHFR